MYTLPRDLTVVWQFSSAVMRRSHSQSTYLLVLTKDILTILLIIYFSLSFVIHCDVAFDNVQLNEHVMLCYVTIKYDLQPGKS